MNDIYQVLDEIGIPFEKFDHPAVYTVEEADQYDRGDAAHSKNLFLRNKKGNRHFLLVLEASKRVNLKALEELTGTDNLSFASPERMMRFLGLKPGAVSPFGLINDENKAVDVLVDKALMKEPKQGFHPNVNTATVVLNTQDFLKFLNWTNHDIRFVDI